MIVYIVYVRGDTLIDIGNVYNRAEDAHKNAAELQTMFGITGHEALVIEREIQFRDN